VPESPVVLDLLEALKVVTHLLVDLVGGELGGLAVLEVLSPVEHPGGDLELVGDLDHSHQVVHLLLRELAGTLVHVDVSLLADDVGETATDTLDRGHGVHDLLLPIDVRTQDTQDVLEVSTVLDGKRLHGRASGMKERSSCHKAQSMCTSPPQTPTSLETTTQHRSHADRGSEFTHETSFDIMRIPTSQLEHTLLLLSQLFSNIEHCQLLSTSLLRA